MPSTIVHLGFAFIVAAALLTDHLDRRAIVVVTVVVITPEVDTIIGLWMDGAHRAVGHTLVFPLLLTAVIVWDCWYRERSFIRERWGEWGVWVSVASMVALLIPHLLLDLAHLDGINVFWPLYDSFYRLEGQLYLTGSGITQTFIDLETGNSGRTGTTATVHVSNPVQPSGAVPDEPIERTFPFAARGWELYLVVTGLFVLAARRLQGPEPA